MTGNHNDDEDNLWQEAVKHVVPLQAQKRRSTPTTPPPRMRSHAPAPYGDAAPAPLHIVIEPNATMHGLRHKDSADILRKLAKGQLPFEDRLDLHGMYADEARQAIHDFLRESFDNGYRCIIIIHGKGNATQGGHGPYGNLGLLKASLPGWLDSNPYVMAFHTAVPKDGGLGACYIYLRRKRF